MEPTSVQVGQVDALRRIRRMVLEENAKELSGETIGDWDWVPKFLKTQFGDSPATLRRYLEGWTALEVYLAEKNVFGPGDVTHQIAFDYPMWRTEVDPAIMRPCKWNTALVELKVLSRVMSSAVQRRMVNANPCFRLGLGRRNTGIKPEITEKEQTIIEKNLSGRPRWMRDCWNVAMCQGFRLSETNCPLDRIDLKLGTISVIGKGNKVHTAPLHPSVRKLAIEARKAGRDTLLDDLPGRASQHWKKFFRRCGLGHLTFHSTRVSGMGSSEPSGAPNPNPSRVVIDFDFIGIILVVAPLPAGIGSLGRSQKICPWRGHASFPPSVASWSCLSSGIFRPWLGFWLGIRGRILGTCSWLCLGLNFCHRPFVAGNSF